MADPRERYNDHTELFRLATRGEKVETWTAMPGIIDSYNAAAQTVTVQPAIKGKVTSYDGTSSLQNRTVLVDVPVQFPAGSGHTLTFPIAKGDECLLVFSARCIDGWWQNGGVQPAVAGRTHSLSDGFAILGFRSKPRALSAVSTTTTQLRSDDGSTYVELNGPAKSVTLHTVATSILLDGGAGTVGISAPNGVVVDGPTFACTGEVTAKFGGPSVSLSTHLGHGPGTSPPTPGT